MMDLLDFLLEAVNLLPERVDDGIQTGLTAFLKGLCFRLENVVGEYFELFG